MVPAPTSILEFGMTHNDVMCRTLRPLTWPDCAGAFPRLTIGTIGKRGEQGKAVANWGRLIFYVSDVNKRWAHLKEKGFNPERPVEASQEEDDEHVLFGRCWH